MLFSGGQRRATGSVDGEVLAELRAIREEIHALSERVAQAASREDLKLYVTRDQFEDHVTADAGKKADWRWWVTLGVSISAILLTLASANHIGLVIR